MRFYEDKPKSFVKLKYTMQVLSNDILIKFMLRNIEKDSEPHHGSYLYANYISCMYFDNL